MHACSSIDFALRITSRYALEPTRGMSIIYIWDLRGSLAPTLTKTSGDSRKNSLS